MQSCDSEANNDLAEGQISPAILLEKTPLELNTPPRQEKMAFEDSNQSGSGSKNENKAPDSAQKSNSRKHTQTKQAVAIKR